MMIFPRNRPAQPPHRRCLTLPPSLLLFHDRGRRGYFEMKLSLHTARAVDSTIQKYAHSSVTGTLFLHMHVLQWYKTVLLKGCFKSHTVRMVFSTIRKSAHSSLTGTLFLHTARVAVPQAVLSLSLKLVPLCSPPNGASCA
eukprot:2653407-Rhodomonas_salina.1